MGRTEPEKKVEGNGTAKFIAICVASVLTGGGAGNILGGINWAKETKDNGNQIAALKAQFDAHRSTMTDQLGRIENKQDRIDGMMSRIWADLQQRGKGEGNEQ